MVTNNYEILQAHRQLLQDESSLYGQIMFGSSRFRQAHNSLDIHTFGINDKMEKLRKKYFVLDAEGKITEVEIPAEKEGDKPTKKNVLLEGMKQEDYQEEMKILLHTQIEI